MTGALINKQLLGTNCLLKSTMKILTCSQLRMQYDIIHCTRHLNMNHSITYITFKSFPFIFQ